MGKYVFWPSCSFFYENVRNIGFDHWPIWNLLEILDNPLFFVHRNKIMSGLIHFIELWTGKFIIMVGEPPSPSLNYTQLNWREIAGTFIKMKWVRRFKHVRNKKEICLMVVYTCDMWNSKLIKLLWWHKSCSLKSLMWRKREAIFSRGTSCMNPSIYFFYNL